MGKFSALLNSYRILETVVRRQRERAEYYEDRALWRAVGITLATILGAVSELLVPSLMVTTLVFSVAASLIIPLSTKLCNFFWYKKINKLGVPQSDLNTERILDDKLRRKIASIMSLGLTKRQETPLILEAYREIAAERKLLSTRSGSAAPSFDEPELWRYVPKAEKARRAEHTLLEEEKKKKANERELERLEKEARRLKKYEK